MPKTDVKRTMRRVSLLVREPEANEVRVTGDFTRWAPEGVRMSHDGGGQWRTVLSLEPGEYQYRLLVDGEWKNHPDATERVRNPFGTENCILRVV